ncbi:hypothetical protein D3C76_1082710 [compost metagenome]
MIGCLQVMECDMIIQSIVSDIALFRECFYSKIEISMSTRHHFSITVVSPDFNNTFRNFNMSLFVKLSNFSIHRHTAYRSIHIFTNHMILLMNYI